MWKRSPPSSGNGLPGLEPRVELKVTRASAVVSHIDITAWAQQPGSKSIQEQ